MIDKSKGLTVREIKGNTYIYGVFGRNAEPTNRYRKTNSTENYTAVFEKSLGNVNKERTWEKILQHLQLHRGFNIEEAQEIVRDLHFKFFGE